jgi:hypothetical protein
LFEFAAFLQSNGLAAFHDNFDVIGDYIGMAHEKPRLGLDVHVLQAQAGN